MSSAIQSVGGFLNQVGGFLNQVGGFLVTISLTIQRIGLSPQMQVLLIVSPISSSKGLQFQRQSISGQQPTPIK